MGELNRRNFLKITGAAGAAGALNLKPEPAAAEQLPRDFKGWMEAARTNPELVFKNLGKIQGEGGTRTSYNLTTNETTILYGDSKSRAQIVSEALQNSPKAAWDALADRLQRSIHEINTGTYTEKGFDTEMVYAAFRRADPMYLIRNIEKVLMAESYEFGGRSPYGEGDGLTWSEFNCALIRVANGTTDALDLEVKAIYDKSKVTWNKKSAAHFEEFITACAQGVPMSDGDSFSADYNERYCRLLTS